MDAGVKQLLSEEIKKILSQNDTEGMPEDALTLYLSAKINEPTVAYRQEPIETLIAKPVNTSTLFAEGLITPQMVSEIAAHPACAQLVVPLIKENSNDINVSSTLFEMLHLASLCGLLPPGKKDEIRQRFSAEYLESVDRDKPLEQQRFIKTITQKTVQEPVPSWADVYLGRKVQGDEIEEALARLKADG